MCSIPAHAGKWWENRKGQEAWSNVMHTPLSPSFRPQLNRITKSGRPRFFFPIPQLRLREPNFHHEIPPSVSQLDATANSLSVSKLRISQDSSKVARHGAQHTSCKILEQGSASRLANRLLQLSDKSLLKSHAYVNGEWVSAASGKTFEVTDPATGKVIGTMPDFDKSDTIKAIQAAEAALPEFRKTTGRERARLLRKWYQLMMDNADDLAKLITWENGKPLADAKGGLILIQGPDKKRKFRQY